MRPLFSTITNIQIQNIHNLSFEFHISFDQERNIVQRRKKMIKYQVEPLIFWFFEQKNTDQWNKWIVGVRMYGRGVSIRNQALIIIFIDPLIWMTIKYYEHTDDWSSSNKSSIFAASSLRLLRFVVKEWSV